ncbi:MAG: pentapeptide repeat-containing protein [Candidatus Scalindua sp.]
MFEMIIKLHGLDMTLIAGFSKDGCPMLMGDLLLSAQDDPATMIVLPTIGNISKKHLTKGKYRPSSHCQKVNLLSTKLAIAWSGDCICASDFIQGMAFRMILDIEKMECSCKPEIENPASIWFSFFRQSTYEGVANLMKETIVNWKDSLRDVDLRRVELGGYELNDANLEGANLSDAILIHARLFRANLMYAILEGADLTRAELVRAKLKGARLDRANLVDADLSGANLSYAKLPKANLNSVNLDDANLMSAELVRTDLTSTRLNSAILMEANLNQAKGLTIHQLKAVKTLYKVKNLDPKLMKQVKEKYSHLLDKPK